MRGKDYKAIRHYCWILRFFSLVYVIVGSIFFTHQVMLIEIMNGGGRAIARLNPRWEAITTGATPLPSEQFYLVLTMAMMAMLVVTSLLGSLFPKDKGYLLIHMTSKAVSVAAFLHFFFKDHQFPYLVGALADGWVIFVIMIFFLRTLHPIEEPSCASG